MATLIEGGSFETFKDPSGNPLVSINRDGTLSTQGVLFPDGSEITSAGAVTGAVYNATTGFQVSGAAPAGDVLAGDGSHFVPQQKTSYSVTDYGFVGDGLTDNTAAMSSLLSTISTTVSTILLPRGTFLLGSVTIPSNVTLDFTQGGLIKVTTGTTVVIEGSVLATPRQIFVNAYYAQGTVSFIGNAVVYEFYPEWWGTSKDGVTLDLQALQACSDAASQGGSEQAGSIPGGTVVLGKGTYYLGTGSWVVTALAGYPTSQEYMNIRGQGPNVTHLSSSHAVNTYTGTVNTSGTTVTWASGQTFKTSWVGMVMTINSVNYVVASVTSTTSLTINATAGTQTGVNFSVDAVALYVCGNIGGEISGFSLTGETPFSMNLSSPGCTGYGIELGGNGSTGTQTHDIIISHVGVSNFTEGIVSTGGIGTSSEVTFINITLQSCLYGFLNSNFNGLDFNFYQLQMALCGWGLYMETAGAYVWGGSASANLTDFFFSNVGSNSIIGFRTESTVTNVINFAQADSHLFVAGCNFESMNPNYGVAILHNSGHLTLDNCFISGSIFWQTTGGPLIMDNCSIYDPGNTWTLTTPTPLMGPGFRMSSSGNPGGYFEVSMVRNISTGIAYFPQLIGTTVTDTGVSGYLITVVQGVSGGQGLQLAVSSNTIRPVTYASHVAAGTISTIVFNGNTSILLIADGSITISTGGNIATAASLTTGQTLTLWYDTVTTTWYHA